MMARHVRATLAVVALTVVLALAGPVAVQAQTRDACDATINGSPVSRHAGWRDALDIDPDEPVQLTLRTPGEPGVIVLTVETGPVSRTIRPLGDARPLPNWDWSGTTDSARSDLSAGLTRIRLTSDGCDLTAWVNVEGGGPFTTMAGAGATIVLAGGLAMQGFGLWQGMRRKGGFKWALIGGIPTGLGACVLSQQMGMTPLTTEWAAAWTTPPVAIGGIVQAGLRSIGGRGDADGYEAQWPDAVDGGAAPPAMPQTEPGPARPVEVPSGPQIEPPPPPRPAEPPPSARVEAPPATGTAQPLPPSTGADLPPVSSGQPSTGAVPPPRAEADPPRSAYARLDAPDIATVGEGFTLVAGLRAEPQAGVSGGTLVRPPTSVGSYILTVQVVADGFDLAPGESWRNNLRVTADAPYPAFELHLTAQQQDAPVRPGRIEALYSVDGQTIGMAVRAIAVIADARFAVPTMPQPEGVDISVPTEPDAPDLTVRIQVADDAPEGRLLWTFDSPHTGIPMPDAHVTTTIGAEPERFVRQIVEGIGARQGTPGLAAYLSGIGLTIADNMPLEFWALLDAVNARRPAGEMPSIFILSEEPYVPWELATVERAQVRDAGGPRVLGAQACVGRWVLGQRRPRLPAPVEVRVEGVAVIAGVYDRPGWSRLVEAEGEAAEIAQRYGGAIVNAAPGPVLRCLGGDPTADLLHFAVHGVYDPASMMDGLVLVDGTTLDPLQVKGLPLDEMPFVFLNACQVGNGNRVLGDYAGMAEAFLYAGASGVVAPLWAVPDATARALSRSFYEQAFAGEPVSEVLRKARAAETETDEGATALAYVFYGHPSLRLVRG